MTLGLRWKVNMGALFRSSLYSLYCFGSRFRTGSGSGVYGFTSRGAGCTFRKTISSVTPYRFSARMMNSPRSDT